MAEDTDLDTGGSGARGDSLAGTFDALAQRTRELEIGANAFARAMSNAFVMSVARGKELDQVLKSVALRMSELALRLALQPVTRGIASGITQLFGGLGLMSWGGGGGGTVQAATGAIKPFAAGGVIGMPTYFPLAQGGLGLAGEAGPEAIMPLRRGADGRLGVTAVNAPAANVTINITTPDADSLRRSETYISGQIARAVARGQRSL
jgi:phage-related minor tail protein